MTDLTPDLLALHEQLTVVDSHDDFLILSAHHRALNHPEYFTEQCLPRLRAGGVDVQVAAICVEPQYVPEGALRRTLLLIEELRRIESENDDIVVCDTYPEIELALDHGQLAMVVAIEGAEAVGHDLELLGTLRRLGVRMLSFTHLGRTPFADGSAEDATGSRLTSLGVEALTELERLGIIVDISHLGVRGTEHALELVTRPVVASHSSCRALRDHHRNLTDDQLREIARIGGVVGINFMTEFLGTKEQPPTVADLLNHICHAIDIAGIDHVGLGPDFVREYVETVLPGLRSTLELPPSVPLPGMQADWRDLPAVTAGLLERGLGEKDVAKVVGGNFLRVFAEVMP